MTKLFFILVDLLLISPFAMASCPLGQKDTHLTIQRVMVNFGRFTMNADKVSIKGNNPNEYTTITAEEINEAVENLDMAINCAQAVLMSPEGDLLPSKYFYMTDEKEKAELIEDYIYFMTEFQDGLKEYRDSLIDLQTHPPKKRNFATVNTKRLELNTLINRAHRKI